MDAPFGSETAQRPSRVRSAGEPPKVPVPVRTILEPSLARGVATPPAATATGFFGKSKLAMYPRTLNPLAGRDAPAVPAAATARTAATRKPVQRERFIFFSSRS